MGADTPAGGESSPDTGTESPSTGTDGPGTEDTPSTGSGDSNDATE